MPTAKPVIVKNRHAEDVWMVRRNGKEVMASEPDHSEHTKCQDTNNASSSSSQVAVNDVQGVMHTKEQPHDTSCLVGKALGKNPPAEHIVQQSNPFSILQDYPIDDEVTPDTGHDQGEAPATTGSLSHGTKVMELETQGKLDEQTPKRPTDRSIGKEASTPNVYNDN